MVIIWKGDTRTGMKGLEAPCVYQLICLPQPGQAIKAGFGCVERRGLRIIVRSHSRSADRGRHWWMRIDGRLAGDTQVPA